MKYTHNELQQSMFDFGILKIEVPKDHELIKMSYELDWEAMLEIIKKKYSKKKGRNSKSLRMMIGLEIAKRKYGLSDQAIVEQLKVDAALKYFCGFNDWVHDIPEASSLSRFRARLDDETLQQPEEVNAKKMIRKVPKRRRHQVITDSTCIEANITYPTDSKLLSKTYEKLVEVAEEVRAETIIQQQSTMIENNVRRAKDRVVSFHETEIRPIFRGKAGKQPPGFAGSLF